MTIADLTSCCGSTAWANAMFNRQPFEDIHRDADEIWWSLTTEDWLEAFAAHPKIGQKSAAKWTAQEQSGMLQAAAGTAEDMARLNSEYESKFGFIYIVCATGKSADEMLSILQTRIHHSPEDEIRIAAAEQAKITHLRLDKLLKQ